MPTDLPERRDLDDLMRLASELVALAWPTDTKTVSLRDALFAHLLEECGELYGAARSFDGRSLRPDKSKGSLDDIADEIGDVLFLTVRIADFYGVSPTQALNGALNKFMRRLEALNHGTTQTPTQ